MRIIDMFNLKTLALTAAATVAALVAIAAGSGTAKAEAACSVVPSSPIVHRAGDSAGGEYFLWGRADVSGCSTNDKVELYMAEETSPGY